MGIDELRIAVTIASFVAFIGVIVWALAKRNRAAFHEAEMLPFLDETGRNRP